MAKQGAFFLEPDDAKTLGDIDYMRTPNKVKHKFPKSKANGGGFEIVKELNSMEVKNGEAPATPAASTPAEAPVATPTTPRRKAGDSAMDMFRQMAKSIKR
ncbi:hypothetical protein VB712_11915 [Spirulina sp. CCNP1310]|uniref:hypothetical protein n=1 Tax=Spirulina sp. CCNP1310 TaxID=3110249 RepID=UPI002B1FCAED|nr:hypothetical protein [Spirulina sp. CCNP1310]MEA5419928.1 hypothetical protein [Spirulina sp. CCNP1310]